jgi:hypothetical protein
MELLVPIVLVFMATFTIFGVVDMIKQINKVDIKIDEDKKIPPCIGHEIESQKENDKSEADFMYNWIREKSGKKKSNPKQMDGVKSDVPFVKTRKKKQK